MNYMKKHFFLLYFFVFASSFLLAQQNKIDSLYNILKTAKADTNRVLAMNKLGTLLNRAGNFSKADSVIKEARGLAEKLNFQSGIAESYRNMGTKYYNVHNTPEALKNFLVSFKIDSNINSKRGLGMDYACIGLARYQQGNYDEALKNYQTAIVLLEATNNKDYLFRVYQFIGLLSKKRGNYPEALKYYLRSLKVAEETGNAQVAGDDYMDIGNIYIEQANDSEAMKNYNMAIQRFEESGNKKGIGNAYCNIGNIYLDKGDYDKALQCMTNSLEIAKETGDKEGMTNAYGNMGDVYEKQGDYKHALEDHYQSLAIDQEIGDKEGVAEDYLNISGILVNEKRYVEANDCVNKSLVLAKELGSKILLRSVYLSKAILDTANRNFRSAFEDYNKYIVYRDSLTNEENTKKIVSEQMTYDFKKKQAVEKAEQDKKDAVDAADKKKQRIITGMISAGLLLVLVFSGLLFNRFRITQKQKKIIEEQKELVEEKNKEVLDSITYAKRLQDAILPPLGTIKKYFPESFVFYKPKDIVAGDFYWMERTESVILIAAADCTGHGVPGAMVSVVCSNALNRAVKEFKITEPGKILDKVRQLVLETFEKSESDVQDGMDISLAAITVLPQPSPSGRENKENKVSPNGRDLEGAVTIQWSGAYNPLWYIQNSEMKELMPDKQPIGKTDNPKPFSTNMLKLNKGDILYLFTDGYADQFGGPKGKKFKYKQLQDKLLDISSQPMAEQKQILEKVFEEWKSNLEQVDDLLIMGIRV